MDLTTQLVLGLVAGGTIFLGLLAGRWPVRNSTLRTGLGMLAAGILVYLMVEILSDTAGQVAGSWRDAVGGQTSHGRAFGLTVLLVVGFLVGLAGLAWLQQRLGGLVTRSAQRRAERRARLAEVTGAPVGTVRTTAPSPAEQLALAIASGIGLHNLSEGLAIGQSAASGRTALAAGLVVGFALHNSTEGFGIVGPLVSDSTRVPWRTLGCYGLLGGGPTVVGVLLGGVWTNQAVDVFVLAVAGGALLYVIGQLLAGVRKQVAQVAAMVFLAAGFAVGWGTEVTAAVAINGGGAATSAATCPGATVEADGDVVGGGCDRATANTPQPVLAAADAKRQQQTAADLMHEKALVPTIDADGTRHYTLTASQFPWQIYPGRVVTAWGYNGSVPGPLLRFTVGDKVAITLVNHLPQPTTAHWHGLAVPQNADGDPMTGPSVAPGASTTYRFTVTDQMIGTHWYHSHVNPDFQVDAGLHGPIIVDPAPGSHSTANPATDVDALFTLSAFKVAGSEGENAFAIDGKAHPLAPTLTVREGQRVRIRLINDSAESSHVMHLHGYTWTQIARDGNPVAGPADSNNITLGPGETADMLVVANNPGTWMLQCHILDHQINPGGAGGDGDATHMAEMGGLTTFLTVTP
ncbi:MAG TPA: multicopper oxidase domain-containing protein [Micromonosporaceae bacterium]